MERQSMSVMERYAVMDLTRVSNETSPSVSLSERGIGGDRPPVRNSFRQHQRLMEAGIQDGESSANGGRRSLSPIQQSQGGSPPRSQSSRAATPVVMNPEPVNVVQLAQTHPHPPPPSQMVKTLPITLIGKPTRSAASPIDSESGRSIVFYPSYMMTPGGAFRILEIIISIIICATVDASQCAAYAVCGSPSSYVWRSVMAGQGFVLFVAIITIFGNLALIIFRVLKPRSLPIAKLAERAAMAEMLYTVGAIGLFFVAACIESWYASWTEIFVTPNQNYLLLANQIVQNPFRQQWIVAAVFVWLQVFIYVGNAIYLRIMSNRANR